MKLRNKKTGEIGYLIVGKGSINYSVTNDDWDNCGEYNSLAELNAEWEDYKENKDSALNIMILTLSNFIENEPDEDKVDLEDCKQMLEKLKALRRLKDNGFKFEGIKEKSHFLVFFCSERCYRALDCQEGRKDTQRAR